MSSCYNSLLALIFSGVACISFLLHLDGATVALAAAALFITHPLIVLLSVSLLEVTNLEQTKTSKNCIL